VLHALEHELAVFREARELRLEVRVLRALGHALQVHEQLARRSSSPAATSGASSASARIGDQPARGAAPVSTVARLAAYPRTSRARALERLEQEASSNASRRPPRVHDGDDRAEVVADPERA
jgi:hypothetical protein